MNNIDLWKNGVQIDALIATMAEDLRGQMRDRNIANPLMVGIHTGGAWIAERLHRQLGIRDPLGTLDISFYRDDFTRIGFNPVVNPSSLPVPVDERHIILVDDVLHTGRTIRAALNELFDYGRPASVMLAVLAQRGGRELPIEADVAGLKLEPNDNRRVKLTGPDTLGLVLERTRPAPEDHPT